MPLILVKARKLWLLQCRPHCSSRAEAAGRQVALQGTVEYLLCRGWLTSWLQHAIKLTAALVKAAPLACSTQQAACRLVWNRIWAVLSDFFVAVGRHSNLAVAMYAVDSLRQLAMRFLTRDELANYSFQNDFLKPFVVVMRLSKAVEIRELIIRQAASSRPGRRQSRQPLQKAEAYQTSSTCHQGHCLYHVLPWSRWCLAAPCMYAGVTDLHVL